MKNIKQITLLTVGIALLASCAKEKEYNDVYKPDVESLSEFPCAKNLKDAPKMLYVPMTLGTPREVADANPFYQGDEKVVKCIFTEDGIEKIAQIAWDVNDKSENIGARRLHTVLEKLLEEIFYHAPDRQEDVTICKDKVHQSLASLVEDRDLSQFIL